MTKSAPHKQALRVSLAEKQVWVGPFSFRRILAARQYEFTTFDDTVETLAEPFTDQPVTGVLEAVVELGIDVNDFQQHVEDLARSVPLETNTPSTKLPDLPTVQRLDGGEMPLTTTKQAMNAVASLEGPNADNNDPAGKWRNIAIVLAHEVERLRAQVQTTPHKPKAPAPTPTEPPPALTMFDFEDGKGPVPASQHQNGEGWVADTADVEPDVFIGPEARVFGNAVVTGQVVVEDQARIFDNARVRGKVQVREQAQVYGRANVGNHAQVYGQAQVFGVARVNVTARVYDQAHIFGNSLVTGNARVSGSAKVKGQAWLRGNVRVTGTACADRNAHVFEGLYKLGTISEAIGLDG